MVGKFERNKDLLQEAVESTASHVGRIATIITGAIVDITREIGDLVADGVEMREAAKKAQIDEGDLDDLPQLPSPDDVIDTQGEYLPDERRS
ncbi:MULTISPECIES: hypothetical protein [Williamsia]|uniref:Uncharacterized protein n=2 Tax=Williamsia TaxID=85043 RepID=A0ABT1H8D4_9NOCA|nr:MULTISPECIES: hypothetical protein [Williamsia]MCP2174484.1 hypothetical protein [Williamsia maris]GGF32973.1 hypothetical protein GCM10007298_31070 [Williamsia phyllosphaerae]